MRLFVAVWPAPDVVATIGSAPRPEVRGVRWTTPEQWHVTLRFFGDVSDPSVIVERLHGAVPAASAVMGPESRSLGQAVLCVPVGGLDAVAAATTAATADIGVPAEDRPFFGHLTLARLRRGARPNVLRRLPVMRLAGAWAVEEVTLVSSRLGGSGSRYEIVERISCRD